MFSPKKKVDLSDQFYLKKNVIAS